MLEKSLPISSATEDLVMDSSAVVKELRQWIVDYVKKSYKGSLASLAREASLPYSTLRRVVQGSGEPDLATVIAILSVVCQKEQAREVLLRHYPEAFHALDSVFLGHKVMPTPLNQHLDSEMAFEVLQMTAKEPLCTRESVEKSFGQYGLDKIEGFIEVGYVEEDPQGKLSFLGLGQAKSVEKCLQNICALARMFDQGNLGTESAMLATLSDCIDDEGLAKIKEYGKMYHKKVMKIVGANPGDINVYAAWLHNIHSLEEV